MKNTSVKQGKEIEEQTKKTTQGMQSLTKSALELYALFLGGRGLKEFISDTNAMNVSMARFAALLATTPQAVGELTALMQNLGGSAEDAQGAFEAMNRVLQNLKLGQGLPEGILRMSAATGMSATGVLNAKSPEEMLKSLAPILQAYAKINAAQEHYFAQQLGISDVANTLLIQKGAGLGAAMEGKSSLQATDAQIQGAKDLLKAWTDTEQEVGKIGSIIAEVTNGPLTNMLGVVNKVLQALIDARTSQDDMIKKAQDAIANGTYSPDMTGGHDIRGSGFFPWLGRLFSGASSDAGNLKLTGPGLGGTRGLTIGGSGGKSIDLQRADDPIFGSGGDKSRAIQFGGTEVSEANPLPVRIFQALGGGGGGGFWQGIGDAISSLGGGGGGFGSTRSLTVGGSDGSGSRGASDNLDGGARITSAEGLSRADHLVKHLQSTYGLSREQAIGAAGVMGYESGDFTTMQEKGQAPGRGGWGYAQWTGPRRHAFMAWAAQNKLDPSSREANEGFIDYEVAHGYGRAITAIKKITGNDVPRRAAYSWEHNYEDMTEGGPGIPAFGGHMGRAAAYARIPNLGVMGADGAAALGNINNQYHGSTTDVSNSMHIGQLNVNGVDTNNVDGIARGIQPVLARHAFAAYANGGPL